MPSSNTRADRARETLYRVMNRDRPFVQNAERALKIGADFLGVENAHLTTIDPQSAYWEAIVSTDPPHGRFPQGLVLDLGSTYCRRTVGQTGSISLHDAVAQGWATDPAFETHGLPTYHGTPVTLDGNSTFGTVCFVSEQPRDEPFSESETMFAELVTRLLEFELTRIRQRNELDRRATLITVLNRVLRHNLRNDINVIQGRVELLADELDDCSDHVEIVRSKTETLIALSEKVRALEPTTGSTYGVTETATSKLIDRIVSDVSREYPSASFSRAGTQDLAIDVRPGFEVALREVVENAAKHSGDDPSIVITTEAVPNAVNIRISDNGPGLPDHERVVLQRGEETALVHGSGLGLWMVYWFTTSHGGGVESSVDESGTTISVTVPRAATALKFADPDGDE